MLTKKPQRIGWENIDMVCHNQAAYQILAGEPVCWDIITAKDGSVARPITLTLQVPAGIARFKLGTSGNYDDVQLVRAYGYVDAWQVGSTATPGAMLKITSAGSAIQLAVTHATSAIETPEEAFVIAIAATTDGGIASSTYGQSYKVFVRALK
jgi:hypothetical protein